MRRSAKEVAVRPGGFAVSPSLPVRITAALAFLTLVIFLSGAALAQGYNQRNLVSDLPGQATYLDPDLVNPWGLAHSSTSPWWASDNHTGLSTLYNGQGHKQPLVVTIPPPSGGQPPASPTGIVFSGSGFDGDRFIFDSEDGTIAGWQNALGTQAALRYDNSSSGAVYKGLTLASSHLYATNFHAGTIDVFDSNYNLVNLAGNFTDPSLPAGYAPFGIQSFGNNLYVTYALQDADAHDDVPGAGHGFVDVFDVNGNLTSRLISNGALNSPWGLAMAPNNFGQFSNDLLVGNFGDGTINVFDPTTAAHLGSLTDAGNNPLYIPGLWAISFGNGANAGPSNYLYFTAGISGGERALEDHGLFGDIQPVPEPASLTLLGLGLLGVAGWRMRRRHS